MKKMRKYATYPRYFHVVVKCGSEEEQRKLYERLVAEGYTARVCVL